MVTYNFRLVQPVKLINNTVKKGQKYQFRNADEREMRYSTCQCPADQAKEEDGSAAGSRWLPPFWLRRPGNEAIPYESSGIFFRLGK